MKKNKLLIYIFLLMISIVSINAALIDNQLNYYKFDTDTQDSTDTNYDLTNNNATATGSGKINGAYNYDGITSYMAFGDNRFSSSQLAQHTYSIWVNVDSLSELQRVLSIEAISGIWIDTDGSIGYRNFDGSYSESFAPSGSIISGSWYHIVATNDGTNQRIYINSILKDTDAANSPDLDSFDRAVMLGSYYNPVSNNFIDGKIDEVGIWTRALNQTEINELYNSGIGLQYPYTGSPVLAFLNISANNITLINNTFYNNSIFLETIVLNTSTNDLINHTYSLNGNTSIQYATTTLNGSFNLNLSEGYYNISFYAFNNETNVSSSNYSFIIDRSKPNIQVLQNLTTNNVSINFSNVINVTDNLSGLKSCTINITYLTLNESDSNFFINCTDTQLFTRAGIYTGFVTAEDNAGNINTLSANGTINPLINVFFNQSNGSIVLNYTPTLYHPDGRITFPEVQPDGSIQLSPVNDGEIDFGLHTITFEKLGFATENFTQIVNSTNSGINVTFNVTNSKIIVSIFDRITGNILTGLTLLTGVSSVGFNANTTTGYVNISNINFISEQYQILASHDNYTTESVFFNYNNQQLLPVNIFLLPTTDENFGTATVQVKSFPAELFISNARCDLLEWKPLLSAYESVSQGVTDVNGEYTFNIELNIKLYKTICTSEGFSAEQILGNGGIITTTGLTYPVLITTTEDAFETKLDDLAFTFINTTETNTTQRLTFTWLETNGIVSQGCINIYSSTGFSKILLNQTCASGSSGEIQIIQNINNTFNLIAEAAVITSDGVSQSLKELVFLGYESFETLIKKYHLDLVIPIMLFFLGLGLGISIEPQNIYISIITVFILEWITFAIIPTTLSFTIVTFISVILGFMYWGVNKG